MNATPAPGAFVGRAADGSSRHATPRAPALLRCSAPAPWTEPRLYPRCALLLRVYLLPRFDPPSIYDLSSARVAQIPVLTLGVLALWGFLIGCLVPLGVWGFWRFGGHMLR